MSFEIEVDVQNLEEVKRKIRSLFSTVMSEDVEKILLDGAKIVKAEIQRRAPVGPTGNLKKAVVAKKSKMRGAVFRSAYAAIDRKKAGHARLVEYGTATARLPKKAKVLYDKKTGKVFGKSVAPMPAKPFFRPAVEATAAQVSRHVNEGIKRLIEGSVVK